LQTQSKTERMEPTSRAGKTWLARGSLRSRPILAAASAALLQA
jgi:hypothetical protein